MKGNEVIVSPVRDNKQFVAEYRQSLSYIAQY
jgi:hypothetical protein